MSGACGGTSAGVCGGCVAGTYNDVNSDAAQCKPCPDGYYYPSYRGTSCLTISTCPAGQGQKTAGTKTANVVCEACAIGTYKGTAGNVACTMCTGGYADQTGQTACKPFTPCTPGQYVSVQGTTTTNVVCTACAGNWWTVAGTETSCTVCRAGKYKMQSTCVACTCSGGQYYANCPAASNAPQCIACLGGDQSVSLCAIGNQPAVVCDGTQQSDPGCAACPAGKQKPDGSKRWCELCPIGTYKSAPSTGNCGACTNKPSGATSVYTAWPANAVPTSNTCPWACVAGYYKSGAGACVSCALTAGKYALAGTEGACTDCTNKPPSNSYYQLPTTFKAGINDCPWCVLCVVVF